MSDFGHYGGSDEEYATVRKHNAEVEADPDSFENWENLIKAAESLEGGLNRNSSPQALATFRDAYDRFLSKFPLLFGYWKKYADSEFNIAGPESAEMVYERGVACISHSVDLWTEYCSFKMETTHDPHLVRELFERGTNLVGLDFLSHPFWDKYIEYEERQEAQDRIFAIHARIIRIPTHQYARYYERFRNLSHSRPLAEVAHGDVIARYRSQVESEHATSGGGPRSELELERAVREKIDVMYYEVFTATQNEVSKRWTYESEIKRPYFHVTELENSQLQNWRKYLDFEEAEGDHHRVVCLYERCLTTCALYDEFWFRYARWMAGQTKKDEEVRIIYIRASTMFVPISRPGIRMQWALFEESRGRLDVAVDIHEAILLVLPDNIDVLVSFANVIRRQKGATAAVQVYTDRIQSPTVDPYTKAALVAEWALLLWRATRDVSESRSIFLKNSQWYADSRIFWEKWFKFEIDQPHSKGQEECVRQVFEQLRAGSRLSATVKRDLSTIYLDFLVQYGGAKAMGTFLEIDRDMFGPLSVANTNKGDSGAKENGGNAGVLDEPSRRRAETRQLNFFELHTEPDAEAQGTADFN